MRKLIVILSVFAVLVVFMVLELVYTSRAYTEVQTVLSELNQSVWENKDEIDNPDTVAICARLNETWNSHKNFLYVVENHTLVRTLDDKISSLDAIIRSDNFNDAATYTSSALALVQEILLDDMPYGINIL